ncbi:MAG: c-type cytochrome [Burkholderiaceae bacterium]
MSEEHETFIKTPKQLIVAIVLAFVIPIALIALLVKYVGQSDRIGSGANAMTEQAVVDRIKPVSTYELAGSAGPAKVHSGEEVYAAQCAACHAAGVAGAPKLGDKAQWGPRIAAGGLGGLIGSSLKGKGAMPAQSGGSFSDLEIAKAVVHMANSGGASFEEPTAESIASGAAGTAAPTADPEKKTTDTGKTSNAANNAASAAVAAAAATAAAKEVVAQAKTTAVASANNAAAITGATAATVATASEPKSVATPAIVNRAKAAGDSVAAQAQKVTQAAQKTTAGNASQAANDAAASAAARVAAAASAATAVSASIATAPATPTTADKLVFTNATDVKAASGEGIPKRLSIFFDSGSSAVSSEAADDLWNLIYFTKSGDWSRIGLSGYTDGTGNKEVNENLSRQRMGNVRDMLIDIGVAEDRIVMVKPEQVEAASGASESARRVDVFHAK